MNRRILLGAGVAAVLFLLLWYVLLFSPTSDKINAAKERTESAEQQVTEIRARINRLRQSERDEVRLTARRQVLRTAIPDQPDLGALILEINDAAVRAGIDFVSISPTPPTVPTATAAGAAATTPTTVAGAAPATPVATLPAAEQAAEIRISLSLAGGYYQVIDFINRLDQMPRLVVLDGVVMTADGSGRLTLQLTARTFTQPGAVPPAPGAPPTTTTTVAGATTTTTAAGATTTTVAGTSATTTTTGATP